MLSLHRPRLALILVSAAVGLSIACGGDGAGDELGDESVTGDSAITGSLALGTELVTTSAVNLRRGPATTNAVIRVLAKGSSVVSVNRTTPSGMFYNVRAGSDEGWVHGGYLAPKSPGSTADAGDAAPPQAGCVERRLRFSADALPSLPADAASVWGANATGGEALMDPPFSSEFVARARAARARGMEVFAYLEGPCGDTGGVDDGERARCATLHNAYNARFAPGTPNTPMARWKPYTIHQLMTSAANAVDYCEIDNLENNVTIPLNPLLREIRALYERGAIHCQLVLKNVSVAGIDAIRADVAPTPAAAKFIAPFHIFEADDTRQKASLDAAMRRLKGPGAVTIISTDTNNYGSAFTPDEFLTCR